MLSGPLIADMSKRVVTAVRNFPLAFDTTVLIYEY